MESIQKNSQKPSKKGPSEIVISVLWAFDIFFILTAITYTIAISSCPGTGITHFSCSSGWILGMPPVYLLAGVIVGAIMGPRMSSPTTNQKSIFLKIAFFVLILLTVAVVSLILFFFMINPLLSSF
ncbi:hypothetical protein J5500_04930 [Candidatus Saccharibacteria bacterium]|nr:hypothetical protein [Candidatus Saccharibacteria bacterium]